MIRALAECASASRFFCSSSSARLRFSANSHCPWVREGLPIIQAANGGDAYHIQLEPDDYGQPVGGPDYQLREAVERIEAVLAAAPVQPFFRSRPDPALPRVPPAHVPPTTRLHPSSAPLGRVAPSAAAPAL